MTAYTSIKHDVLAKLQQSLPLLRTRFGIDAIGIFGSVSREEDTPDSDIDILYHFSENRGDLHDFIGLKDYLETTLGRHVDLISLDYINPHIRTSVTEDAVLYDTRAAT